MKTQQLLRQRQQGSSTVEMAGLAMAVALLILGLVLVLRANGATIGNSLVQVYVCNITGMGCGSGGGPLGGGPPGANGPGGSQTNAPPVTAAPAPANSGPSAAQQGGSVVLDVIPVVGEIKGFIEVFTGRDLVTGEDLGHWRWAGLLGIVGLNEVRFLRYGDDVADALRRGGSPPGRPGGGGDGQRLLPPGRPGQVTRNRLEEHEFQQAQDIVAFRGGHFEGAPRRGFPGIDGTIDGIPASLKRYDGSSPAGILRHVSQAERSARNAGYTGVEVFVDARNVPANQLLDFARNGPLTAIPNQGTIGAINIHTRDGWVRIINGSIVQRP